MNGGATEIRITTLKVLDSWRSLPREWVLQRGVKYGPQARPLAGEPQVGDPLSLPAAGCRQLRARLHPSRYTVSRLLSPGPPLHRAHLGHPCSSPQGFPDLRLPRRGSPQWLPVPPHGTHLWCTLQEWTMYHQLTCVYTPQEQTMHHGVTRVCMPQEWTTHHQVTKSTRR